MASSIINVKITELLWLAYEMKMTDYSSLHLIEKMISKLSSFGVIIPEGHRSGVSPTGKSGYVTSFGPEDQNLIINGPKRLSYDDKVNDVENTFS